MASPSFFFSHQKKNIPHRQVNHQSIKSLLTIKNDHIARFNWLETQLYTDSHRKNRYWYHTLDWIWYSIMAPEWNRDEDRRCSYDQTSNGSANKFDTEEEGWIQSCSSTTTSSADSSIKNEEANWCVLTSLSSSHLESIPCAVEMVDRILEVSVRLASTAILRLYDTCGKRTMKRL